MTRVPADEQRLREIEQRADVLALRDACEGWPMPNRYSAALDSLLADRSALEALLRVREQELAASAYKFECSQAELDECDQRADRVDAQLVAAVREAAEYRETNESVRVCADHTAEIVNGGGCLVCSLAAAETALREALPWMKPAELLELGSPEQRDRIRVGELIAAVLVADPAAEATGG